MNATLLPLRSLKQRILLPLLAVLVVALTLIAVEHKRSFQRDLSLRLQERAEHICSLIHFIGGAAPKPGGLQHIVGAIGGEPEVNLVVVIAGNPARVVASNRLAMLGRTPEELTNLEGRTKLSALAAAPATGFRFENDDHQFDYFRPVSLSVFGPGGNELQRGAVLVSLDTHGLQERMFQTTVKSIASYAGMVLLLAAICWVLLHRHVLQPVGQIGEAMDVFHAGECGHPIDGSGFAAELARLAGAWNGLVHRLQSEHAERTQAEEELRRTRDEFEERVTERTAELSRSNDTLQMQAHVIESMAEAVIVADEDGRIVAANPAAARMFGYGAAELPGLLVSVLDDLEGESGRGTAEEGAARPHGSPGAGEIYRRRKDGSRFLVRAQIRAFEMAGQRHFFAIQEDITASQREKEALRASEEKFRQMADHITDVFWMTSPDLKVIHYVSPGYEPIWGRSPEGLYANPHQWIEAILPEDRAQVFAVFSGLKENEPQVSVEFRIVRPDGTIRWVLDRGFQVRDAAGQLVRLTGIASDITERKRVEAELEQMHRQLIEISRAAGMAEVATSVLHNVGNVLNSVNVSATVVTERVKKSKVRGLARVVTLLDDHAANLGAFVSDDPQGRNLPAFLRQLSEQLTREQQSTLAELQSLRGNIEHIKEIVAMQQCYAKVAGVTEVLPMVDLVEDSLRMNASALAKLQVEVVRDYQVTPPISVEKHKVLQILVNLIRNAQQACRENAGPEKKLTIRIASGAGTVRISVSDNGVGIPPENLTRIFSHGFTTKQDGHGFGLHSGANTAREMGGSLTAHSAGPGRGATFTLELPAGGSAS